MCLWKKNKANNKRSNKGYVQSAEKPSAAPSAYVNKEQDEIKKSKESVMPKEGDKSACTQESAVVGELEKSLAPTIFTFDDLPPSIQGEVQTDLSIGEDMNPFAAPRVQSKLMGTTSMVNAPQSPIEPTVARTQSSSTEQTPTRKKIMEEVKTQETSSVVLQGEGQKCLMAKKLAPTRSAPKSEDKTKSSVFLYS